MESELSRITPRLLTWAEGETEEVSVVREKVSDSFATVCTTTPSKMLTLVIVCLVH